jgi:folate-binding protein YgfZ
MTTWTNTLEGLIASARATSQLGRRTVADHYGDPAADYCAIDRSGGLCDRADRAVLRVTGRDRAAWLHNLTTNQVKSLAAGEWRYAFALNVKGRILFDLSYLMDEDVIWLDLDDRLVEAALTHLNKYIIMEEVKVEDVSDRYARLTVLGADAVSKFSRDGSTELAEVSQRSATSDGATTPNWTWRKHVHNGFPVLVWHDPAWQGQAADLIVPVEIAASVWSHLTFPPASRTLHPSGGGDADLASTHHSSLNTHHSLTAVGRSALETRRIELGIPAPVSELNEEALPAETGQLDRAVSFTKGCYLGQEVVERMRAHKSVARKLVGVVFDAEHPPLSEGGHGGVGVVDVVAPTQSSALSPQSYAGLPAPLLIDAKPVGTFTSVCHSPSHGRTIGLGYLRVAQAAPGTKVRIADRQAVVTTLPFRVP